MSKKVDKPIKEKEKSKIEAQPSQPIVIEKGQKEKIKERVKTARKLEDVEITAKGSITAGGYVAETDTTNLRKTTLRQ